MIRIGVRGVSRIPIVEDAAKKLNAVFDKPIPQDQQRIARGLFGTRDEDNAIGPSTDYASVCDLHSRRSIYKD